MPQKSDIAWCAGLFEGEGCFTVMCYDHGAGSDQPRCYLAMTDEEPVRRFHQLLGVGHVYTRGSNNPKHKPQWQWQVAKQKDVRYVIETLYPWLSPRRKERADELMMILKNKRGYNDAPEI